MHIHFGVKALFTNKSYNKLNVQGSVHCKYILFDIFPTWCNVTQFIYFWKTALHVSSGISTHHQEHTQLYLEYLVLVKPLVLPAAIVDELELVWAWCGNCIDLFWCGCLQPHQNRSDTVYTVVCPPDDGWRYHPKHVEQFSRNKYSV